MNVYEFTAIYYYGRKIGTDCTTARNAEEKRQTEAREEI